MKKLFSDFRDFILQRNAFSLAIGVIIGAAVSTVVNSIVNDLVMPPIGLLLGRVNFSDLYIQLNRSAVPVAPHTPLADAKSAGAVVIAYGNFITNLINFVIIAFVVFLMIRMVQRAEDELKGKSATPPAAPTEKTCPYCQTQIPVKATRCPHCTSQLD